MKTMTILVALLMSSMAFAVPQYTVTDLGEDTMAFGINIHGQIVGTSLVAGRTHGFFWSNGVMTDLGAFSGEYSLATAINDNAQVVGYSTVGIYPNGVQHAFLWQNGVMQDLGISGNSQAFGINNAGKIVGSGSNGAFLWQNGVYDNLTSLRGAFDVNNSGQIVGLVGTPGLDAHAAMWDGGSIIDLAPVSGYDSSFGRAINNLGQICGYSLLGDGERITLWNPTSYDPINLAGQDLGYLFESSDINDVGQVVGFRHPNPGASYALLWENGMFYNLNDLTVNGSGFFLQNAVGINNLGQIIANGSGHAYLLTPVPEPTAFAPLVLMLFFRRR